MWKQETRTLGEDRHWVDVVLGWERLIAAQDGTEVYEDLNLRLSLGNDTMNDEVDLYVPLILSHDATQTTVTVTVPSAVSSPSLPSASLRFRHFLILLRQQISCRVTS